MNEYAIQNDKYKESGKFHYEWWYVCLVFGEDDFLDKWNGKKFNLKMSQTTVPCRHRLSRGENKLA